MEKSWLAAVKTRWCAFGTRGLVSVSRPSKGMAEGYGQWPSVLMAKSLLAAVKTRQCASGTRALVSASRCCKYPPIGPDQWPSVLMAKSLPAVVLAAVDSIKCGFGTERLGRDSTYGHDITLM